MIPAQQASGGAGVRRTGLCRAWTPLRAVASPAACGDCRAARSVASRIRLRRGSRARLLGLALLDRRSAGPGLLIPGCSSVHTFGMRFALEVLFLGGDGAVVSKRADVPPRRVVRHPGAAAVLERPAQSPLSACSSCLRRSVSSSTAGFP